MDFLPLDEHLCFSLYGAARAMTKAYGPLLGKSGLTYPQYLVLAALGEAGALSVKALGDRLELDSGTLSPLLKRLERDGHIARGQDQRDGRKTMVRLTPLGQRARRVACQAPFALFAQLGIPADRLRRIKRDVDQLAKALQANARQQKESA